ncbi:MAG: hypothetical protein JST62_02260 [Bacteroidetes bacterium]|nr:hypothetical protein [Bacteroidota bacterium]
MNITELQDKIVQVVNYQATYLTLKYDTEILRFDFIDKKEFNLSKDKIGQLDFYETHPLLIDYNEEELTTFINTKPNDLDSFVKDFELAIDSITQGWRSWTKYVTNDSNFTVVNFFNNVKNGTGILLKAPFSITMEVNRICEKYGVMTKTLGGERKLDDFKLLLVDDNYVIAREFRLHDQAKLRQGHL